LKRKELAKEAAAKFGRDRISVAIDTRKNAKMPSSFEVVSHAGTKGAGIDAVKWARKVEALGAGAILPTSMDADGRHPCDARHRRRGKAAGRCFWRRGKDVELMRLQLQ